MAKRLIPKTHCIEIFMWRSNDNVPVDLYHYQNPQKGDSSMMTGAGSLTVAMKIIKQGLESGYTHFNLCYPVAMQGGPTNTPYSNDLEKRIKGD